MNFSQSRKVLRRVFSVRKRCSLKKACFPCEKYEKIAFFRKKVAIFSFFRKKVAIFWKKSRFFSFGARVACASAAAPGSLSAFLASGSTGGARAGGYPGVKEALNTIDKV